MQIRIFTVLSLLFVLAGYFGPAPVAAQQAVRLADLQIEIWPEFDRPEALVIYRGALAAQAGQLPVQIAMRIPARVGEPNAVALRQAGTLVDAPYTREVAGEWAVIRFSADEIEFQLEYYDPGLLKDGVQRQMTYAWPGDLGAENLRVVVQQPPGATNLQLEPAASSSQPGPDGLMYHTSELGPVDAGRNFEIQIGYQKADDRLTVDLFAQSAQDPVLQPESAPAEISGQRGDTLLLWTAALAALAVLAVGGYWLWSTGRLRGAPSRRASGKKRTRKARPPGRARPDVFCHQCGQQAQPGDHFCRNCGTELRKS